MTKSTDLRVPRLMAICLMACTAIMLCCRKTEAPPAKAPINFDQAVQKKNREFLDGPQFNAHKDIYEKRSQIQDQILREFDQCPQCFVKKIVGAQRTYLFDAITDCAATMRVGARYDGGKWVCDPQTLPDKSVVYSFGVGDDISFDMDMAGMFGCEVYMFDPSPSVVTNFSNFKSGRSCGRGHIYFQPVGLGPVSSEEQKQWNLVIEGKPCAVKSLADIARSLNHTHVDILKIDIEGGEFAALKQMLLSRTLLSLQVKQLMVEFHLWNDDSFADFVRVIESLKKQGYLLFRKEFNPYAADKCAEYAFIKRNP
ncbi:MAG: FkbM family methyltransferase [Acidobacteriota bacterium]